MNYAFNDYSNDYRHNEADMLMEMLGKGATVIIFTDYDMGNDIYNKLNVMISVKYDSHCSNSINSYFVHFIWEEDSCYDDSDFIFRAFNPSYSIILSGNSDDEEFEYEDFGEKCVIENDTKFKWKELLLTGDYNHEWVAAACDYEGGKIVLVSYPLLFTNYYVLEDGGAQLLMRILSQAGDKRIVRYDAALSESYIEEHNKSQSPLRVFIDHKSLRWAVYLTLLGIVISLFFTARRKQRVIPLVDKPKNQTIEMIKHIGLLYYRNHDNANLISNKYRQLVFELQRQKLIHLDDEELDEENLQTLADLAEFDTEQFNTMLTRIKAIDEEDDINVSDKETKRLIDAMNKILNNM